MTFVVNVAAGFSNELQRRDRLIDLAEIGHNDLDIAKLRQAARCLAREPT